MTWQYQWARKDLQRGDHSALQEMSNHGRWGDPNPVRLQRLTKRGFIKKRADDKLLQVTMKGRAALARVLPEGRPRFGDVKRYGKFFAKPVASLTRLFVLSPP